MGTVRFFLFYSLRGWVFLLFFRHSKGKTKQLSVHQNLVTSVILKCWIPLPNLGKAAWERAALGTEQEQLAQ